MSTRAQRIENIINGRKPFAAELFAIINSLEELEKSLGEFNNYYQQLQDSVEQKEIREKFAQLKSENPKEKLLEKRRQLEFLAERFSRDTLNIGVIGETGAGKSTLLKSLSGLDDDVIPARPGGACTAVRSKIQNLPLQGEVKAEIERHTPITFLEEVILQYYDELPLGSDPSSLDEFANKNFSLEPPSEIKGKKEEQMYKRLVKDYFINIDKYKSLLESQESTKKVIEDKKEISEWVTQKRNQDDFLTTFNHLVVRQAEISCHFKDATTGEWINDKIMLVDVPGMGDTRLGDEKLMLETLGKDVDAVLYLFRPDAMRYLWKAYNDALYYNAKEALNNFDERTFIILNFQGNNLKACENLQENKRFKVVEQKIINCADPKEAYKVFNFILDYLEKNINDLDRKYAQSVKNDILETLDKIEKHLEQFQGILEDFRDEHKQFSLLFSSRDGLSGFWAEITSSLGDFRSELKKKYDVENQEFKEKIENTIKKCQETKLPDIETITKKAYTLEMDGYPNAYLAYLQEIRTHLSRNFLTLDLDLQGFLEDVKVVLSEKLAKQGKLEFLSNAKGSKFFQEINQQLSGNSQDNLYFAFHYLEQFNVSYAGLFLREIRKNLEVLYSHENGMLEIRDANNIAKNLGELYAFVLNKCQQSFREVYTLPNQIAYAMVEEFIDRTLYATGAKDEWRDFIWQKRYQIFDELKKIKEWEERKKKWNDLLIDVHQKTQRAISRIKNSL
ncbi:MAG: dynamin family protein [Crocosphaera sp.]